MSRIKRMIVLLLAVAMLVTGSGFTVLAESLNEKSEPAVTEAQAEDKDQQEAEPVTKAEDDAKVEEKAEAGEKTEAGDKATGNESKTEDAKAETKADWEKTIPNKLPEDVREAVVEVAKSQLKAAGGRYTTFTKADGEDWDASFVMFVLNYAEVKTLKKADDIHFDSDTAKWMKALDKEGMLQKIAEATEESEAVMPEEGDIVFIGKKADWSDASAAVVTNVDGDKLTVIGAEADKDEVVKYAAEAEAVLGFVSLKAVAPKEFAEEEKAEENAEEAKTEDADKAEETAEDKEEAKEEKIEKVEEPEADADAPKYDLADQTLTAELTSAPGVGGKLRSVFRSTKGTEITLSGKMPKDATVKAYPVNVDIPGETVLTAYDITIYAPELDENGEPTDKMVEWQPDGSINVSISDKALKDMEGRVGIYHMEDKNAEAEFVQNGNVGEDGVMFRAEQFSIYVVTEKEPTPVVTYEFTYGSESNGTKKTFEVVVPEGEQLLEPATPSDPKLGRFLAWYWDEDLTDEVHFDNAAAVTATDAPRTVKVYGKFDGKKYLSFMSLPMEDGDRRTFETFVLEPDETTFDVSKVNTYGSPVNKKFRGWVAEDTVKDTIASDPYNNKLRHTSDGNQYYTLDETIKNISQSMTFYPVVKDGIWVTFDADPDGSTGGLVDGKRTKKVMAAEDETWEDVYKQIETVVAEGYELGKWVEDGSDDEFTFDSRTVGSDKNSYTFDAKWTPKNDVNVTFMYWKEDVEPELYTLIKTENKSYTAGQEIDLTTLESGCAAKIAANGEFLKNDADMEFFYLAELTSGDGTTDEDKWDTAPHSRYINVKGDGSTVINVWYDRKIVKLTFQDCYSTLVRLGEPLDEVWPTIDRNNNKLTGFKLNDSLNALYIYPTASSMVLGGLTDQNGAINLNAAEYKDRDDVTHFIQPEDYYTDTKTSYQAVKTLQKITGTPSNTAKHWYEKTDVAGSATGVNYGPDSTPDKSFGTSASSIVTREVDGYRIDYAKTRARQGSSNVSVSSRYEDGAEKQLGVKVKSSQFLVYYKANKYSIALFDGERMLARNDGVKFKTPLTSDWVTINENKLDDLLAVDSNGVPTAEAEALARQIYGKKAPADYMQFMGWYIDRDFAATDSTYSVAGKTMPSADLNLYARWEPRTVEVTVDKGTRSGQHESPATVNPSNVHAGTQILDYDNTADKKFYAHANTLADYLADGWMNPTWKNHVFLGWEYRSKTAYGSDEWTEWKSVTNWNDTVDHDTQIRGLWQDMTPFAVHYFVDGREVTLDTASYLNGGTVILQGYDKTNNAGEVFRGWKVRGGDGTLLEPGDNQEINGGDLFLDGIFEPGSVNPGEEPALYVFMIWVPNDTSSGYEAWDADPARTERTALKNNLATYYGDTGTTDGEWKVFYQEIIYSGDPLTTPPSVPASFMDGEGKFQGWYENAGLTKRFDNFGVVDTPHSTILYAGFKTSHKVTYHTIGSQVLEVQNYTWDGQDQLNTGTIGSSYSYTDTNANKTFKVVKWTTYNTNNQCMSEEEISAADPNAKFYNCGVASTDKVTSNMNLWPVMVEGYTLSFNTDGGSYIEPQVYRTDEPTEAPDQPTKGAPGQFEWMGWYQEAPHDNTEHRVFHWGDTISQDTTVYGWFSDLSEQQEITASVWMQNADGETYSYAGSATVASDDPELANDKQPINTLFTLTDGNRQALEGTDKPIYNLLGNDRAYFEYNASKGNTSVMVTKDKDENVLNLYYDRKHFDMVFNAGNGSFDTNKANASGTELSNSNKTYTIHNVWIDKDISDVWPDASYIVDPADNAFVSWQAGSNTYKIESTASKDMLVAGGVTATNNTATYNANYVSTVTSGTSTMHPGTSDPTEATLKYTVVINRYVGDKLYREVLADIPYSQYKSYQALFNANTVNEPAESTTKISETDYPTVNISAMTSDANGFANFTADGKSYTKTDLDSDKMDQNKDDSAKYNNASRELKKYQYSYGFRLANTEVAKHYGSVHGGEPLYFSNSSNGLGVRRYYDGDLLDANHAYRNGDWSDEQGFKFIYETTGNAFTNSNVIYNVVNGVGTYFDDEYSRGSGYYYDTISDDRTRNISLFTGFSGTFADSDGDGIYTRSNTYVTEYRRDVTVYTPGAVVLTYYYTEKPDPAPAQHAVTRNYGNSTDNAGSFDEGAIVKASDLGVADVAAHTADIQAYFGDKYNASHTYSFSGWYLDAARTTKLPSDGMVMPNEDVTVYAGWKDETENPDAKVTVTTLVAGSRTPFSRTAGTVFGNFNIPVNAAAGELNQDGRTGDVLLGWYREGDEYRTVIQPTEPITEDITVKPLILQAGQTFEIIYDLNGIPAIGADPIYGQEVDDEGNGKYKTTQGYYPGANAVVASVDSSKLDFTSKPSYAQFYCWNTKADGTGDSYFPDDTVKLPTDGDLKLYAMYSPYMNTSLVYELGYEDAPNINEGERTVVFKDYKDGERGAHELYTNSTYSVETQYIGETSPYYEQMTFNNKKIPVFRPGYTFLGWLDKAATTEYSAASADQKEAMLLHYGDKIRANAPTVGEDGNLVKEYLVAQWKQDVLKVNVYTAGHGQWSTNATLVKEAQYTTTTVDNTINLAAGDGTADHQGPGHTFATGTAIGYDPSTYSDYPIYGLAAVNGTVVTSVTYQEKADHSGYAWTYTKDGKTVEMKASDTLNLYYVPYPADLTVKYRIVHDGEYLTEDDAVTVKELIGQSFDEKTYTNIDLNTAAQVEDFAVASGYTDSYELVGIYHGSKFDKDKSIGAPKKIYYKNGQFRINSADGPAVDDGEVYVVYHKKSDVMVEARNVKVSADPDNAGSEINELLEGKSYIDVPKGGSRGDIAPPPDLEGYDKKDTSVGTVSGENVTVSQENVSSVSADANGNVTAGGEDMTGKVLLYRYLEPRKVKAYVFSYGFDGKPAFEKSAEIAVTSKGTSVSGQNLLSADDYTLEEVYYKADEGGNFPADVTGLDSAKSWTLSNTTGGIMYTGGHPFADGNALYYIYTPKFRDVQVIYLKWTEDGYVPLEGNYDKDVRVPLGRNIDFSDVTVTYGDDTYTLIPTVSGYTPAAKNFLGTSKDDLTELSSRTGENRKNGFYVKVDGSDKRVTNAQKIFYVYYPDPRPVYIHFVEKKLNSDLGAIEGVSENALPANVSAGVGIEMTKEDIELKTVLTDDQKAALGAYSFAGAYVGGIAETDFASISGEDQTVTGRNLANEIDGLTFEASGDTAAMLLGDRDIYAVYYPEPRTVPAHAVIYNNGKLTVNDDLLTEEQKSVAVTSSGIDVTKINSASATVTDEYTDDDGNPQTETHTYTYKGMGVNYGPTAGGLDMEANKDSLKLKNSIDGAQVMNGAEVADILDMNDAVYYVFYPEPREVNVYYVSQGADGSLTSVKKAGDTEAATVTSTGTYEIGTSASGSGSSIKVDKVRTISDSNYDFKYIAAGPDMGIEYDANNNAVISTLAGDLTEITSDELYLKNEPASVMYSTKASMEGASPMTVAKPAIYIVYKPYVKLTVTKTVDGEYGDQTREFDFSVKVDGTDQETFKLKHNGTKEIWLPVDREITVTETKVSGYTIKLEGNKPTGAVLNDNEVTFTLTADASLDVTNEFDDDSIVPSGIEGSKSILIPAFLAILLAFGLVMSIRRRRRMGIGR